MRYSPQHVRTTRDPVSIVSSLVIALLSFVVIFGSALFGMFVRHFLPEHHLRDDTRDTVKLGAGLIATLAALVLGLLVGSAKSSFDSVNAGITQAAVRVILMDRTLARYGPEAHDAREQLRRGFAASIEAAWPDQKTGVSGLTAIERSNAIETLQETIEKLRPASELQRSLHARLRELADDMAHARWLVVEQQRIGLPTILLVVLVLWLAILYGTFGLFAPRNATVIVVLLVCALSAAASLFLILELNRPLEGMIKASRAPMVNALEQLGR